MSRRRKLINKKILKLSTGKCRICQIDECKTLEYHRIKPGCEGGEYTEDNVVICCANCHTLIHKGVIIIDKYYLCSNGQKLLRIIKDGEEKFI